MNPYHRTARSKQAAIVSSGRAGEFRKLLTTDVSIATLGWNRRPPGLQKLLAKIWILSAISERWNWWRDRWPWRAIGARSNQSKKHADDVLSNER
jgi:hypothetical protein